MASDDQDILAKISQLAGQINRHKNSKSVMSLRPDQQPQSPAPVASYSHGSTRPFAGPTNKAADKGEEYSRAHSGSWSSSRGGYSSNRYNRGGKPQQVHRHRSLVLNGNNSNSSSPNIQEDNETLEEGEIPSAKRVKPGSGFVSKTDRHLQLINADIYQKDSQDRAKALAETRHQKSVQKDQREKEKFKRHLQQLGANKPGSGGATSRNTEATANYELTVEGIRFRVVKNGSKLVKFPGDPSPPSSTPKTALVGGVRFHRSKNGNMYRAGIIRAHRNTVVNKINEPCKAFTTTGICAKGPKCHYIHDPSKVAACKEFLLKGSCPSGDSCDLSHDLTPERTPACLHFAKGNCSNPNCRYSHVHVSPTAPVCRPFAIYGYCEKGANCEERHVHECPDFSNSGTCTTKGCKLPHRHKANVMRKNPVRGETSTEEGSSDVSSDEEMEEINSDDVDSVDLDEEYFGEEDKNAGPDIPMEQDYLQLS